MNPCKAFITILASLFFIPSLIQGIEPQYLQPYDRTQADDALTIDMKTYIKGKTEKEFKEKLTKNGFVVLLNAISPEVIDEMNATLDEVYERAETDDSLGEAEKNTVRTALISESLFKKYTGKSFFDLFNDPLYSLGNYFFSGIFHKNEWSTVSRRVKPPQCDNLQHFQLPIQPHIDAMYHGAQEFVLNFWTPLEDCGLDKPTLLAYLSGPDQVSSLVQFDQQTFTFDPKIQESVEKGSAPFLDELPCFYFILNKGDLVVISNWTLHSGYANTSMPHPRMSVELRASGDQFWYQ